MNIQNLTTAQLHKLISIKEQIEALESQLDSLVGGGEIPIPFSEKAPKKRRMSASTKRKMAAAQSARWAKIKGNAVKSKPAKKDKRRSSAFRTKLSAAAKLRWKKAKAAGKKRL